MSSMASAFVPIPADTMTEALRHTASELGLKLSEDEQSLSLTMSIGTLTMQPAASGVTLELTARTHAKLQVLRDTLAERLDNAAPGLTVEWSVDTAHGDVPANIALTRVRDVHRLSPSYYRLRLEGDVARFADLENGFHFKLLFSPDGTLSPSLDKYGVTQWPGGVKAWHRPTYTTRAIDPNGSWLDFDVFIHEGGRVTNWCRSVRTGDRIAISGPGGGGTLTDENVLLIGDETALPVIARMLETAPATTNGEAVIFVPNATDAQPITGPDGMTISWVVRDAGVSPLATLQKAQLPTARRFVFFAAERAEAKTARAWLTEQGFARHEFRAAAYWTA